MAKIYNVSNVEEAVELASKFKKEGKYNWFRGQVCDWPPHSSLFRTRSDDQKFENADYRYKLFQQWVKNVSELKHLLNPENVDELEAIMQHYGIPTDYIDFTTEPGIAGFFAADTKTPLPERNSCIYCLNTDELFEVYNAIKDIDSRQGCEIKKVTIDVSNLWRLQAQHGVFLYANYNWELDYNMDKIIFPYTGYPSYPTMEVVYPPHKSSLEILIDQYEDRLRTGSFHRDLSRTTHNSFAWEEFPDGFYKEAFISPDLIKQDDSWSDLNLKDWLKYPVENFNETVGVGRKFDLKNLTSEDDIKKSISYSIVQILRLDPSIRNKTIDWELLNVNSSLDSKEIADLLTKVWNGMRLLPFDDDDIGEACGYTIYFYAKIKTTESGNKTFLQFFIESLGEGMKVGFTNPDNSGSYAFSSYSAITELYCIDLLKLVTPEYAQRIKDPYGTFTFIYNPRILFDFPKFKKHFARQIIPSQIIWGRRLIIFNPAKLRVFGIP